MKYEKVNFEKMFIFNITSELSNPMHFNSVSNNGWLDVFMKGKFILIFETYFKIKIKN